MKIGETFKCIKKYRILLPGDIVTILSIGDMYGEKDCVEIYYPTRIIEIPYIHGIIPRVDLLQHFRRIS